jgi:hypothetical protein
LQKGVVFSCFPEKTFSNPKLLVDWLWRRCSWLCFLQFLLKWVNRKQARGTLTNTWVGCTRPSMCSLDVFSVHGSHWCALWKAIVTWVFSLWDSWLCPGCPSLWGAPSLGWSCDISDISGIFCWSPRY